MAMTKAERKVQQRKWNKTWYYKNRDKELARFKALRDANVLMVHNHLGKLQCSKCGYDKYFSCLDFHHRDPAVKEFTVGNRLGKAMSPKNKQLLLKEINKCDLLCKLCHAELHAEERGEICLEDLKKEGILQ